MYSYNFFNPEDKLSDRKFYAEVEEQLKQYKCSDKKKETDKAIVTPSFVRGDIRHYFKPK